MPENTKRSRITCNIPLDADGLHQGDLLLRYSDNTQPLGYYPIPICVLANAKGPTAMLIGGVHGDEFEGPTALMRLVQTINVEDINGRIIVLPTLNKPAIDASTRISPLDQVNMNRAFPGDENGGPTHMLAHFIEQVLMPLSDIVIDLHTGGKSSIFTPCTLVSRTADQQLFKDSLNLAGAFGLPLIWLLGEFNDDRSVNSAALRNNIPMIATELGGGGGNDPVQIDIAEKGICRCLSSVGILDNRSSDDNCLDDRSTMTAIPRNVEIRSQSQNLYAPVSGLFDRQFNAGDEVKKGQFGGFVYPSDQPWAAPIELRFPETGLVLAHGNRGNVIRGDMLAMVANDVQGL